MLVTVNIREMTWQIQEAVEEKQLFPKQNQEPITFAQQMFFIMNLINHMKQPPNFWFPGKPEP